jgi:hypothetical protein
LRLQVIQIVWGRRVPKYSNHAPSLFFTIFFTTAVVERERKKEKKKKRAQPHIDRRNFRLCLSIAAVDV